MNELTGRRDALTRYAWAFVLYLIGVILFGAWVRITGSGAGCGSHWPTCHGELIPMAPATETIIEYTHRLTSGLCGPLALLLVGWVWRRRGRGRALAGAALTTVFIVFEALIGAGLVLQELVAQDDSVARAVVISLHLVNTLLLTGAASLTAWWCGGNPLPRLRRAPAIKWLVGLGLGALLVTSMTGAITALGDTLFPVDPTIGVGDGLMARVRGDLSSARHFLVRLRVLHPIIAVLTAAYTLWLSNRLMDAERYGERARSWALVATVAILTEVGVGLLNIALAAPGWIQLTHLFVAQWVWIATMLMGASAITPAPSPATR